MSILRTGRGRAGVGGGEVEFSNIVYYVFFVFFFMLGHEIYFQHF